MRIGYAVKGVQDFAKTWRLSREMMLRESWTHEELGRFQQGQLSRLVKCAAANSPFYRELYSGVNLDKPVELSDLPVTNKKTMMENYDRFVTDPKVKVADLGDHLSRLSHDEYYLAKYRVLSTSGSSGEPAVFIYDRNAWITATAANYRGFVYMGLEARLWRPTRCSHIMADNPRHLSTRSATSNAIRLYDTQHLSAAMPVASLVHALNGFQPEAIILYPSIGALLATEQLEGRLRIQPRIIESGGEVCTDAIADTIENVWGTRPFNAYGTTETCAMAWDCSQRRGLHVFEDLVILEVVDDNYKPVPDGIPGSRILVTNLFNYAQPIIRYEISDILTMSTETCPCGRPFRLISHIEGRSDDNIELEGIGPGRVPVHALHFRKLLTSLENVKEYQVVYEDGHLHLNLVIVRTDNQEAFAREVEDRLKDKLESLNVKCPPIRIHFMEHIQRDSSKMGKFKTVEVRSKVQ